MPRISIGRPPRRSVGERTGPSARAERPARRPRAPRRELSARSSSPSPKVEPHLEVVGRQRRRTASPHSISVTPPSSSSSPRPEVDHLAELLQPVDVEVVHAQAALGTARTRVNVGLVTGSSTPRARAEALRERGLAGAEVADQQDQVAAGRASSASDGAPARRVASTDVGADVETEPTVTTVDRGRRGQRQLGPHEVGPHLAERLGRRRRSAAAGCSVGHRARRGPNG